MIINVRVSQVGQVSNAILATIFLSDVRLKEE